MYKPTEFMFTDEEGTSVHAVRDSGGDVFMTIWPDRRDDRPVAQVTLPIAQVRQLAKIGGVR